MALLVLIPAQGGEDWRAVAQEASWVDFQVIWVQVWIRNTTAELETISKMKPPPSNLVKQKPCNVMDLSQLLLWT